MPIITPTDDELARMGWYARQQLQRRLNGRPRPTDPDDQVLPAVTVIDNRPSLPDTPVVPAALPSHRRAQVRRLEPGLWELTNGVSTALTFSAQAAWDLINLANRRPA